MAYQVTEAVLKHSRAEGAARMVLFALSVHAQPDGRGARPGNSLLAKEANLTIRGVEYAIKNLLQLGEIRRESTGGGATSSSYQIVMPGLDSRSGTNRPPNTVRGAARGLTPDTPESCSGGTPENGDDTPEQCAGEGRTGCGGTPEHISPPNNVHPRKWRQVPPKMVTGTPENGDGAYKEEPEHEPEHEPESIAVVNSPCARTREAGGDPVFDPPFAPDLDPEPDTQSGDPLAHPAVVAFQQATGRAITIPQAEEISRRIAGQGAGLEFWRSFLRNWLTIDGYGSKRISAMLTAYDEQFTRHRQQEQRNAAVTANGAHHGLPARQAGGGGGRRKRDLAEQLQSVYDRPIPDHWGGGGSGET